MCEQISRNVELAGSSFVRVQNCGQRSFWNDHYIDFLTTDFSVSLKRSFWNSLRNPSVVPMTSGPSGGLPCLEPDAPLFPVVSNSVWLAKRAYKSSTSLRIGSAAWLTFSSIDLNANWSADLWVPWEPVSVLSFSLKSIVLKELSKVLDSQ